jgi:hypothetical protein|tara:strand:- start:117 stop:287 length:171 start_codon:yes stop_codon:yes gene_type:complete
MPFKSQAQRKWMYANKPEMAKMWEDETPAGRLPSRLNSKSTSKTKISQRRRRRKIK